MLLQIGVMPRIQMMICMTFEGRICFLLESDHFFVHYLAST
jgi:hypothetical protein